MDFISGFAKVDGCRSIIVVVNIFSNYVVFILASHACPANKAAHLFFKHVKYWGCRKISSVAEIHGSQEVFERHFKLLGGKLKFFIANHPQR